MSVAQENRPNKTKFDEALSTLFRLKTVDFSRIAETRLRRCLNTFDLISIGIGSTLGAGVYIVTGEVAKQQSGPSVVISFLIAATASILAGVCYAEFGARVPKSGSAYVYTYVTVGEFMAFVVGWNLVLEYVIGTASVASGTSSYLDSLIDNRMGDFLNATLPMSVDFLGPYPDFFAFGLTLTLAVVMTTGVKISTLLNKIFAGINILNITIAVVAGITTADPANWSLPPHSYTGSQKGGFTDNGGFMPFGFTGMLAGASTCFYAFVGFDVIATTGEEVKNPQKAIPISIIISLLACCAAYCSVSIIITLMVPYYELDATAALPVAFEQVGLVVIQWVISIGAIAGLSCTLLGAIFALPRILYAMGSDGLIFSCFADINQRFGTPVIGTLVSGTFAALMALLFDLDELVDMLSIGTLMAYTLVACSVLLLRYKLDGESLDEVQQEMRKNETRNDLVHDSRWHALKSHHIVALSIIFITFFSFMMGLVVLLMGMHILPQSQANYLWLPFGVGAVGDICCIIVIYRQPQSQQKLTFKIPLLPIVAGLSISINVILMLQLSSATWIRFGIWMALGLVMYFGYGIWHSHERETCNSISESSPLLFTETENSDQTDYKT
ncbi:cationic amino acid transporter 2-like [Watersipora subatra]|uniref:cationic amino acid transporter 2-like n=1 Tax=Watersipora subatra TaxID=2589382 RepID=UPI00355B1217